MLNDTTKLNVLVAYPYAKKPVIDLLKKNQSSVRFVLDSGAFTAWKAGKPINLDDYCRFIESLPIKPWRYFSLDVIGDPHGTMKNYETMLARGFNPVPIFTRGEDVSVIDDYYKTSDVVGIGGLVGTPGNRGFVKGIMKHIGQRKVHWLGFTELDFVKHYQPYMCDSSGWDQSRYGQCKVYLGNGSFIYTKFEKIKKSPSILNCIKRLGFDIDELLNPINWKKNDLKIKIGVASFIKYQFELEKNVNTKIFAAVTSKDVLGLFFKFKPVVVL